MKTKLLEAARTTAVRNRPQEPSSPVSSPLPTLLSHLRQRRGVSVSALARRAQISRTTLYRWESGESLPRIQELEAALDALEVSWEDRQHCLAALNTPRSIRHLKADANVISLPVGLGEMMLALRYRSGKSQQEAAVAIGMSQGMVSQWEREVSIPDAHSLTVLCQAFQATPEEASLLLAQNRKPTPSLPQDYDALNQVVRDLIAFEPTPHLELPFLALASRYHALWKKKKIEYEDAAAVWGHYADFLSWRHGRYADAIRLAKTALQSIQLRPSRLLVGGHFFAFMALFSAYNLSGQPEKALTLLDHFEDRCSRDSKTLLQFFRGEALCRAGSYEQGFRLFEQAIAHATKETQFVVWSQVYAEFLCRSGRYNDALKVIVPSARTETRPSVLHGHAMTLVWALAGSGERVEAERLYRETRPQLGDDLSPLLRAIVEPAEDLLDAAS